MIYFEIALSTETEVRAMISTSSVHTSKFVDLSGYFLRTQFCTSKQAVLNTTANCVDPFIKVQKVRSETPQNQGASTLNKFKKQVITTTTRSITGREDSGRKFNLDKALGINPTIGLLEPQKYMIQQARSGLKAKVQIHEIKICSSVSRIGSALWSFSVQIPIRYSILEPMERFAMQGLEN